MPKVRTDPPVILLIERGDWLRTGNSVGFHCPECDAMVWTYVGLIGEYGGTHHRRQCPQCEWSGKVRLDGFGGVKQ